MTRLLPFSPFSLVLLLSSLVHADDLGQRRLYENLKFYAQTSSSTGAAVDADSLPNYRSTRTKLARPYLQARWHFWIRTIQMASIAAPST
jgi:hypothetical protein